MYRQAAPANEERPFLSSRLHKGGPSVRIARMRREDYVFCIGYEGSTAIVDGKLMRRHSSDTSRQLAEAGLFKQAICSALWSNRPGELEESARHVQPRRP